MTVPNSRLNARRPSPDHMTKQQVEAVLARVQQWPQDLQVELAKIVLEIETELSAAAYRATEDELAAIDEALAGDLASDEETNEAFASLRRA